MEIKSYKILTFGCQMNLSDSGTLAAILNSRGYYPVEREDEADVVILNTCSVREKAEERVFGRLGELSALKKKEPGKKIAVVGCMAQRLGDKILQRATFVDIILGTDRMYELPRFLNNGNGTPLVHTEFGHEQIDGITPERDNGFAAFLTISRGCDQFCTFCIVPYVRGQERSYSVNHIVKQVKDLVSDGAKEITLLGQNVNSFRDGERDFAALLKGIAAETDIRRIRFMTSHPKDLSDRLLEVMAAEPRVMGHLHLPLQSGSDRILKRMGRGYTLEHYVALAKKVRAAVPEISLTTDLIVGFPSETEDEFKMTLAAVEALQFDSAFMFRYSPREGTVAFDFEDDVSEAEKIHRLTLLINLQKRISFAVNQREVEKVRSVLVDGSSRRDMRILKGKTEGNKTILFEGNSALVGEIRAVRVKSADSWTLHGELTG